MAHIAPPSSTKTTQEKETQEDGEGQGDRGIVKGGRRGGGDKERRKGEEWTTGGAPDQTDWMEQQVLPMKARA